MIFFYLETCGPDDLSCIRQKVRKEDQEDEKPKNQDSSLSSEEEALGNNSKIFFLRWFLNFLDTLTWISRILFLIALVVFLYRPVRQFLVQRNIIGQSHLQARNPNPSQLPAYSHLGRPSS